MPIMGDDGCCAFALSGQAAAAPPKTPMNSRRRIHSPCKGKRRSPISTLSWQARVRPVPLWVDCVEKVLPSVGTDFMRAAGALGVLGRGGPILPERIQSVIFPHALRGHRQPKSEISSLSPKFF